jgi:hypothetical protein
LGCIERLLKTWYYPSSLSINLKIEENDVVVLEKIFITEDDQVTRKSVKRKFSYKMNDG